MKRYDALFVDIYAPFQTPPPSLPRTRLSRLGAAHGTLPPDKVRLPRRIVHHLGQHHVQRGRRAAPHAPDRLQGPLLVVHEAGAAPHAALRLPLCKGGGVEEEGDELEN